MADHYAGSSAPFTWNGAGTKWGASSGAAGTLADPTSAEKGILDGSTGGTITVSGSRSVGDFDCTNFTGLVTGASTPALSVFGNLKFGASMTFGSGLGAIVAYTLAATSSGKTITANGNSTCPALTMNGVSGAWTHQDAYNASGKTLTVTNGSWTTGGFSISAGIVSSNVSNTRTIDISNSTLTLSSNGGTAWNLATTTGLSFTSTGSLIKLTNGTTFAGGGLTYNNLELASTASGNYTITGANTVADFKCNEGTTAHTITFPNATTAVTTFTVAGSSGKLVTLQRTGASGAWTLSCSSGTISVSYCSISNSTATGGATFNADATCVDGGGNTGWNFAPAATDVVPLYQMPNLGISSYGLRV